MGFLDKLRTPKLFGYGGSETAGESTAADRYLSQMELERNLNPGGSRGYGSGFGRERQAPMMRMMQAPKPMRDVRDKMDVVYDQRPEMFKQQMDLQKAGLEQKGKLGFEELSNQRRGQDIDSRELDLKKWALENPGLELREVEGGNFATFDKRTGKLVDTGVSTGTVGEREKMSLMDQYQRGQIGLRNQGGLAETELRNKGGLAEAELRNQGNLAVANVRETPPPMPASQLDDALTYRAKALVAQNPAMAKALNFDPETGKFLGMKDEAQATGGGIFGKADDGNVELRKQAAQALFGSGAVGGLGSSALGSGGQTRPTEAPGGSTQAPHVTSGTQAKPIVQVSPSTGKRRQSLDGGKTWEAVIMAQEPVNDWVDEPDDWTTVDDWVEEPAQSSIPTRPVEMAPVQREQPGLLKRAWDVANEPLLNIDTSNDFGKAPVNESPGMARVKGFFGGAGEAVGDVLSSFTSPTNLAAMALTGGSGMLARKGALAGARALGMAAKIPDAGAVAHGATGILDPNTGILDKGLALAEVAGGSAGLRMPLPKLGKPINPNVPVDLPKNPTLPVKAPEPVVNAPRALDYSVAAEVKARDVLTKEMGVAPSSLEGLTNKQLIDFAEETKPGYQSVRTPAVPSLPELKGLPNDLKGAKPRFNMGDKSYEPIFQSDLDKSLFIIAQKTPSKRNQDYLDYVMSQTGLNAEDAVKLGVEVRGKIKEQLRASEPGAVTINQIYNPKPETLPKKVRLKFIGNEPDLSDPVTAQVYKSAQTNKPVPKEARITPNEEMEIPDPPELTGNPVKDEVTWRDYASVPRAMQSAYDISFPFRQGIGLAHTKGWWKAWPDMIRSVGDEGAYRAVMDSIEQRPNFTGGVTENGKRIPSFAEQAGLAITDLTTLVKREENIGSKIAEKFPLIRASNRGYTAFANKLRADVFDSLIDDATNAGLNPKQDMVLAKAIADYVNNASGRGNLGSLESSATTLNNLFFSPRLMASRVQMLNPMNYTMAQPFVRKQYWKSLGAIAGAYTTFTALNNMAGGTTGTDDPLSSDFGRTQIGNTRFDPSGGILPYLTLFARVNKGMYDKVKENKKGRYADKFPFNTPQGDVGEFFANKASPYLATALKLGGADKNRPFEAGDQALRMFTPIMIQDLSELLKEDPSMAPFGVAQSAVGVGVNTYEKGKPPDRLLPEALDPLSGGNDFTIPRSFQRR